MTLEDPSARVVTFRVSGSFYALPVTSVERVLRYMTLRPVPGLPSWIDGVFDHDGRVVPVLDLARRLGVSSPDATALTRILLVAMEQEWCGLVVDQVLDVRSYPSEERVEAGTRFGTLAAGFYRGVVRRGDDLVMVLDPERLLSTDERATLQHTATEVAHA